MIYLDNAATSYPKPETVISAVTGFMRDVGASPGRSGHRLSASAGRMVYQTRKALVHLFKLDDPGRIIFCENATAALNTALFGLLRPGDRVLVSSLEHNAVMRPLRYLAGQRRVIIDILPMTESCSYDLELLKEWCASRSYRLAVFNHASNVNGTRAPLAEILPVLRENSIVSIVDGAQSAGACEVDLKKLAPDVFCFTGHKSLLGPPGTGGFYLRPGFELTPLIFGGTGSRSELEEQPDFLPDCYESGTLNSSGIAGLKAGLEFIKTQGLDQIIRYEKRLAEILRDGLREIPGLDLKLPRADDLRLPLLSFTIADLSPSEIGFQLDRKFGIMVRVGLHCAPGAHKSIDTFPHGTVRLAPGFFNTSEEMEQTVKAVAAIAAGSRSS